jgi:hypothetical protein
MAKKEKELMFLGDQPRALKKIPPATEVKKRPVVNINKVDQDADLFNKVGKSPAKLKTKNPDPFGDDLINMDDFGEFKPVAPKTATRPSPSAGSNEELQIDAPQPRASKKASKKKKYTGSSQNPRTGYRESPSKDVNKELGISPGGKTKKASKQPDDGFKFYGKESTGLGDFSRKHGMQYATQKQFEKDFNMDDGEKAGGRPGRGKLKTQGMNKAGKRKAGFSGRGSGAALRGF